jgi:hypothetical protein
MSQRDQNASLEQWLNRVGAFDSPTFVLAYHLHQLGFSILPLASRTKRPARKWKRFQTERCDALDLVAWFVDNDFQPGIVTGAISGIVVVDCDQAAVPDSARQLCDSTLTQQTTRGKHFVYRHPGYRCGNRQRINGDAVDIRGDGGYVAAYREAERWTADRIAQAPLYEDPQACAPCAPQDAYIDEVATYEATTTSRGQ